MSKKSGETLTSSQRAELAAQVKGVRLKLGLTQQELANEAGVTRQSVGNIELGATIPQASTLLPVLQALGISPKAAEFSPETSRWLAIIGGIMDSIPLDRRDRAGRAAVESVTDELVASANVSGVHDDAHVTQHPDPNHQGHYGTVAHPYTDETGELMDE